MTVTTKGQEVTTIIGTHMEGMTYSDVQKLNIPNSNKCSYIPVGFEKYFQYLTGIRVAGAGLVSLTQDDIKVFPYLRNCDMFNNRLQTLDSNLFDSNPYLQYLYFGDNRLDGIGHDILKPLKHLKEAILQFNSCIGSNAKNEYEVPKLQEELNQKCPISGRAKQEAGRFIVYRDWSLNDD
jgi:hypothetical protein